MSYEDPGAKENFYYKQTEITNLMEGLHLDNSAYQLRMEAFKQEQILNIYLKGEYTDWTLARTYSFCSSSGELGPKLREGDRQIPEGIYRVAVLNPKSKYYLSLGLNYPNERDMRLANPIDPGSDIYIHGGCQTEGCIPITDEKMAELYLLATDASTDIEVVILPFQNTNSNFEKYSNAYPQWKEFWKDLFLDVEKLRI